MRGLSSFNNLLLSGSAGSYRTCTAPIDSKALLSRRSSGRYPVAREFILVQPVTTSPAIDGDLVCVYSHRCRGFRCTINLEVRQECRAPADSEGRWHGDIQILLDIIEPHGLISNIAGAIARLSDLHVVPRVRIPVPDVAGRCRVQPYIGKLHWSSGVRSVVPALRPAIALESKNDSLTVRHHLVHIEFQNANVGGGVRQIEPTVVKEVGGGGVCAERCVESLASIVGVVRDELAAFPAEAGRANEVGGS
jgi:hypothetical protein